MSPKVGKFEFSWISRRVRIGFSSCLDLHMHYYTTVSASSFQVLICSGWRNSTLRSFIRFLAGLRIGPAFLDAPPVISGEASNADCHFFRISFWKMSTYSSFLKISLGRGLLEKWAPFLIETSIYRWKSLLDFISESGNTVKESNDAPLEKRRTSLLIDTSHQMIASTRRRASSIRFDSACEAREST